MPQNNNTEITKEMRDGLKINQAYDDIPTQVAKSIVPVFETNPKLTEICNLIKYARRTTSGGATIHPTHATKRTFITAITYSLVKDATCDTATDQNFGISLVQKGETKTINFISCLTTTAQSLSNTLNLKYPIEVDKNTTILIISNPFTVGEMSRTASIIGYEVEE